MANVFDAAKYILEKQGEMSTMKLQKLCYYAQAWSLVWNDKPLFKEDFQAWTNGPVCSKLFEKTNDKFSVNADDETGGEGDLTDEQKAIIDDVVVYYGVHDAQWLSQLTRMEDPWNIARNTAPSREVGAHVITKESMRLYYKSL